MVKSNVRPTAGVGLEGRTRSTSRASSAESFKKDKSPALKEDSKPIKLKQSRLSLNKAPCKTLPTTPKSCDVKVVKIFGIDATSPSPEDEPKEKEEETTDADLTVIDEEQGTEQDEEEDNEAGKKDEDKEGSKEEVKTGAEEKEEEKTGTDEETGTEDKEEEKTGAENKEEEKNGAEETGRDKDVEATKEKEVVEEAKEGKKEAKGTKDKKQGTRKGKEKRKKEVIDESSEFESSHEMDSDATVYSNVLVLEKKEKKRTCRKAERDATVQEATSSEDYKKLVEETQELSRKSEYGRRRTVHTQAALKAKDAIQALLHAATRVPQRITHDVDKLLDVMQAEIIELEIQLAHERASREEKEQRQSPPHLEPQIPQASPPKEVQYYTDSDGQRRMKHPLRPEHIKPKRQAPPPKPQRQRYNPSTSYANAIKAASSTVVVKAKDGRDEVDVQQQIEEAGLTETGEAKSARKIHQGVKLQFNDAEAASKAMAAIRSSENLNNALEVKVPGLRKKRVLILNVPPSVSREQVTKKLYRVLQLENGEHTSGNTNLFEVMSPIEARLGAHFPVTLPEPLANSLLRDGVVCLGARDCRVKNYVTIVKCHSCQLYDHVATQCKNAIKCARCSGDHTSKDCQSNSRRCAVCTEYNLHTKQTNATPVNTNHYAYSRLCPTYTALLRVRQIELDRGFRKLTVGQSVVEGNVYVQTHRGNQSVRYCTNPHTKFSKHNNPPSKRR